MAEVLTVANQKGGVGKTTTALCIATGLMNRGKKVLFVDVDPQRNSTQFYGAETDGVKTMYDFYMDKCSIKEAIQNTKMGDIVPCDKLLKGMEGFFTNGTNPYRNFIRLKKSLEEVKDDYDFIIIDTPPNLGYYMSTALIASDKIIIPFLSDRFSVDGLSGILESIEEAKDINPNIKIGGAVVTGVRKNQKLDRDTIENLPDDANALGFPYYHTYIRYSQTIRNTQAAGESLFEKNSKCAAAQDYNNLIDEILKGE